MDRKKYLIAGAECLRQLKLTMESMERVRTSHQCNCCCLILLFHLRSFNVLSMLSLLLRHLQTKRAYEKASEEGEAALHTLEKADNDPNSTKAKIDKVTLTCRSSSFIAIIFKLSCQMISHVIIFYIPP